MRIHFVMIGEGRSDEGLIPHIERLIIALGADEVTGTAPDFNVIPGHRGHSVGEKLRTAVQLEPAANLVVIHRDADGRDPEPRYQEVTAAAVAFCQERQWVAVIPVQETEAWLLLDESAIRLVAGKPNGRAPLTLPAAGRVEHVAHPKEVLEQALVAASELTGRRAAKFRSSLSAKRKQLLEQLPIGGELERLSSWIRFRADLAAALSRVSPD
jgi:hypothetical protein